MKLTQVEDGVIFNNLFEHNAATGFWCDQHCGSTQPNSNWFIIARNTVRHNDEKGIFYEVSHHSESEAQASAANGYTEVRGVAFRAADSQLPGLSPVYRLMNPSVPAHLFTPSASERSSAMSQYGFTVDEGIGFHASASTGTCLVPVYRLLSPVTHRHRLTASAGERDLLKSQGWTDEGIRFYAAAP